MKDWASLTAALDKVKAAGKKGITFSGDRHRGGQLPVPALVLGLRCAADQARLARGASSALALWTGWLKKGYAPNSVINNTQTTSWQEFATGDYAFAENGTWQLANAKKAGFEYGIIPVPGSYGGTAPAPTGGEFVSVPVQQDRGRYATIAKLVGMPDQHRQLA